MTMSNPQQGYSVSMNCVWTGRLDSLPRHQLSVVIAETPDYLA